MKGKLKTSLLIVVSLILITPYITDIEGYTQEKSQVTTLTHNPILFLHGQGVSSTIFYRMRERFNADGWPMTVLYAYNFADTNNCSVQANINNANSIKQWVKDILNETGAEKIDLVGHSMGGLSSRYYIKFLGGNNTVDDFVSLGCPHHSEIQTQYAKQGGNELALILNKGDETPGGLLNDTLGIRNDPILNVTYIGKHIPGNISYTSIYSPSDGEVPVTSSQLNGAYNISIAGITHSQLPVDPSVYPLVRRAVDDFNTTFLPTPPTSLKAITEDNQVSLSWQVPVDDGNTPIIGYKIYRAANVDGPFSFYGNTTTLSYIDLNVTNGETYYYMVTAVNGVGESAYSAMVKVTPQLLTTTTSSWGFLLVSLSLIALISLKRRKKTP